MADDFRKLRIWQNATSLVEDIYTTSDSFPKQELYSLTSQIRRSSNAVPANIAEACGRYYKKDKVRVLYISRGEIEETRSHLIVATRLRYVTNEQYDTLENKYNDLKKQVNAYINHLKSY